MYEIYRYHLILIAKNFDSNSLVSKQKQKQTTKQNIYMKMEFLNSIARLNFFLPLNGHQNCLHRVLPIFQANRNHQQETGKMIWEKNYPFFCIFF